MKDLAKNKIIIRFVTFTVITALLCQNIAWAGGDLSQRNKLASESAFKRVEEYLNKQDDIVLTFNDKMALAAILKDLNQVAYSNDGTILRKIEEINRGLGNINIRLEEKVYKEILSNGQSINVVVVTINGRYWRKIYLNHKKLDESLLKEIGIKTQEDYDWAKILGTERVWLAGKVCEKEYFDNLDEQIRNKLSVWQEEINNFTPVQQEIFQHALRIKGKKISFDIERTIRASFTEDTDVNDWTYSPMTIPLIIGLSVNNELMIITAGERANMLDYIYRERGFLLKLMEEKKVPFYFREDIFGRLQKNSELFKDILIKAFNKSRLTAALVRRIAFIRRIFLDRCWQMKLPELFGFDFHIDDKGIYEWSGEREDLTKFLFHRYGGSLVPNWLIRVSEYKGLPCTDNITRQRVLPIFERLESQEPSRIAIRFFKLYKVDSPWKHSNDEISGMTGDDILRIMKETAVKEVRKWLDLLNGQLKPEQVCEIFVPYPPPHYAEHVKDMPQKEGDGELIRVTYEDLEAVSDPPIDDSRRGFVKNTGLLTLGGIVWSQLGCVGRAFLRKPEPPPAVFPTQAGSPQPKPPPVTTQAFDVDEFVERVTDRKRISETLFGKLQIVRVIPEGILYVDFIKDSLSKSQKECFKRLIRLLLEADYNDAEFLLSNINYILIINNPQLKARGTAFRCGIIINDYYMPKNLNFKGEDINLDSLESLLTLIHEASHVIDFKSVGEMWRSGRYYEYRDWIMGKDCLKSEEQAHCSELYWIDRLISMIKEGKLPQGLLKRLEYEFKRKEFICRHIGDFEYKGMVADWQLHSERWGRTQLYDIGFPELNSYLENRLHISGDRIEYLSIEYWGGPNYKVRYRVDKGKVEEILVTVPEIRAKVPGGRWLWLRDLLKKHGLSSLWQVPIEQAFIGIGYIFFHSGLPFVILPLFVLLHYVHYLWQSKENRETPSIRNVGFVTIINLMGFLLSLMGNELQVVMFIISSVIHFAYNYDVEEVGIDREGVDTSAVRNFYEKLIAGNLSDTDFEEWSGLRTIYISKTNEPIFRHREGIGNVKRRILAEELELLKSRVFSHLTNEQLSAILKRTVFIDKEKLLSQSKETIDKAKDEIIELVKKDFWGCTWRIIKHDWEITSRVSILLCFGFTALLFLVSSPVYPFIGILIAIIFYFLFRLFYINPSFEYLPYLCKPENESYGHCDVLLNIIIMREKAMEEELRVYYSYLAAYLIYSKYVGEKLACVFSPAILRLRKNELFGTAWFNNPDECKNFELGCSIMRDTNILTKYNKLEHIIDLQATAMVLYGMVWQLASETSDIEDAYAFLRLISSGYSFSDAERVVRIEAKYREFIREQTRRKQKPNEGAIWGHPSVQEIKRYFEEGGVAAENEFYIEGINDFYLLKIAEPEKNRRLIDHIITDHPTGFLPVVCDGQGNYFLIVPRGYGATLEEYVLKLKGVITGEMRKQLDDLREKSGKFGFSEYLEDYPVYIDRNNGEILINPFERRERMRPVDASGFSFSGLLEPIKVKDKTYELVQAVNINPEIYSDSFIRNNVMVVREIDSGKEVIIKYSQFPENFDSLENEIYILSSKKHPYLLESIDGEDIKVLIVRKEPGVRLDQIPVFRRISADFSSASPEEKRLFLDIVNMLILEINNLHEKYGIVHGDIKPQNILIQLDEEGKVVKKVSLIDFEGSFLPGRESKHEHFCGTEEYLAPEMFGDNEIYDGSFPRDWYALGRSLVMLLSLGENEKISVLEKGFPEAYKIMEILLRVDPAERIEGVRDWIKEPERLEDINEIKFNKKRYLSILYTGESITNGKRYWIKVASHAEHNRYFDNEWDVIQEASRKGKDSRIVKAMFKGTVKKGDALHSLDDCLGGRRYVVFEEMEGEDLSEVISDKGLSLKRTLFIARQVAEIMKDLHDKGVIHRDLAADNIRVGHNDSVKIYDFNNSWCDKFIHMYGIPVIGKEKDIFDFGLLLLHMLTGKIKLHDHTLTYRTEGITDEKIGKIIERCMANRKTREFYSDFSEVIDALNALNGDNGDGRGKYTTHYSVKPASNKVYSEARLAQVLYEKGYVEGTGEENKYIKPTRKLLKLWEVAVKKELASVFVSGYLVKLEKLGKSWEVARISNQATGEEEVYQIGVYQRTVGKVKKAPEAVPSAPKGMAVKEDAPKVPGLTQQILIAFNQLEKPTLRELIIFIKNEWGTAPQEKDILVRIGLLNINRRRAGQKPLELLSEEEAKKRKKTVTAGGVKEDEVRGQKEPKGETPKERPKKPLPLAQQILNAFSQLEYPTLREVIGFIQDEYETTVNEEEVLAKIEFLNSKRRKAGKRELVLLSEEEAKKRRESVIPDVEEQPRKPKIEKKPKPARPAERAKPAIKPKLSDLVREDKGKLLQKLEELDWNLKKFHDYIAGIVGRRRIPLPELLTKLDLVNEFKKKYKEIYLKERGIGYRIAKHFGISCLIFSKLKKSLEIVDPAELLPPGPRVVSQPLVIGMNKEEALVLLESMNWNLKKFHDHIAGTMGRRRLPFPWLLRELNLVAEFKEKYKEIYLKERGVGDRIAKYFGISRFFLSQLKKSLDIVDPTELLPAGPRVVLQPLVIEMKKEEALVLLESMNWNLKKFHDHIAGIIGRAKVSLSWILGELNLVAEFKEKYNAVYREKLGFIKRVADYFCIDLTVLRRLTKKLGITDPEDIVVTKGIILPIVEKKKGDVLDLLDRLNWNLGRFQAELGFGLHIGMVDLIIGLDIKDDFEKKFREMYRLKGGRYEVLVDYFGVHEYLLKRIVRKLGIDVSCIELVKEGSILEGYGLKKEGVLRELDELEWNLPLFKESLAKRNIVSPNIGFADLIRGLDIVTEFLNKYDEEYKKNQGYLEKTARVFGLWDRSLKDLLISFGRKKFKEAGLARFKKGELLTITEKTKENVLELFRINKWNLTDLINIFRQSGWLKKRVTYKDFIIGLDVVSEFKEELLSVFRKNKGGVYKTSEYFGITSATFWVLVKDFEIKLDIPETEEQEGFNKIVLGYAQELKKAAPIGEIKEKLKPLIEGFKGWEVDAEKGEIKIKFMGSNTLVIRVPEDKRYRVVFEWNEEFGLTVVLKESGRDIGEDIIYDLRNCKNYDEAGQHKAIGALWKGKRKDFKGRDLNRIIERYARLLREGKSLSEIRDVLLKQIEEFGNWEIEIAKRTLAITPIYGSYNDLIFDRLTKGKLFIRLQWDNLVGLAAVFGKGVDNAEDDLFFDTSPFSDFGETAAKDNPKNLFAKKIGVRDELNRARLNKVILKYINLLRAGKPLDQIKEEMAEEMNLLGSWRRAIESPQFTTTPVKNNILNFQSIPKGTYEISLEWLDSIGVVAVFHKEGGNKDSDLLYDINSYKDYNESAEKAAYISARKFGERQKITSAYLEGFGAIVKAKKLGSGQRDVLVYLGELILKYADYLKENRPLDEIRGLLAPDIERFGVRELELKARSFTVSPIKFKHLLFLGLSPGKYYVSVFWHNECGLLVGLKPHDENDRTMKMQIYDVSPYQNYNATDKGRQQLCASIVTSKFIDIAEAQPEMPKTLAGVISKDDAKLLLEGAEINWNLRKFHNHIAGLIGRKKIPLVDLLRELDLADEFKKKCKEVYIEKGSVVEKSAEYFGITVNTFKALVKAFEIDLDIPETEEQKGFNRIVLGYAQELKRGTKIEEIKEKISSLIEGFNGWETVTEKGEIKAKFTGSNTLIIGALEDKRYRIVFEWHKDVGLILVLKEPENDSGSDLLYDLGNCKNYDESGQYKKISAIKKGKRKEIDLNRIIERYARLLKDGKSLPEIRGVLLESIEGFGSWGIEVSVRTFTVSAIYGIYNKLMFDRLPSGKLFIRLQWDDLVGLIVVFGKQREDSGEDLIYDPSPYAEFDESATNDNPNQISALKIGVREELNRVRLNKVILKYINLLRAGKPLDQMKEEMIEEINLLGCWGRIIKSHQFTTTPVKNNILNFQSIPKRTYEISLEWLDDIGVIAVFHEEGGNKDCDLLYDINSYKNYNESAEEAKYISARKLGERQKITSTYLEGFGATADTTVPVEPIEQSSGEEADSKRDEFSLVIRRYADLLREGRSLAEIKEEIKGELDLLGSWEKTVTGSSFAITPVKNNTLHVQSLANGTYNITLEWIDFFGMVLVFSKDGDRGKDLLYDINGYKDYDVKAKRCTRIPALKLGERKWLSLRYLEKIILKYAGYLKEGKSVDEIRIILAEDIGIFAVRELELDSKSFVISPAKDNRLYFRGLLPGAYYVTVSWHKDYGLMVTLIARDTGNKTQIYHINRQEDGRFNADIVTPKVRDIPTANDVIDLEGRLFLKNEIRAGTLAKLRDRYCIVYGNPVLTPDYKIYLQFKDGKIEEHVIRKVLETLQIYSERQRKWLLLKEWVGITKEKVHVEESPAGVDDGIRYPMLERFAKLRDTQGNIYILLGKRHGDTEEVLLDPENMLVLRPVAGGKIVRVTVKEASENGWDVLEDEENPELPESWVKISDLIYQDSADVRELDEVVLSSV